MKIPTTPAPRLANKTAAALKSLITAIDFFGSVRGETSSARYSTAEFIASVENTIAMHNANAIHSFAAILKYVPAKTTSIVHTP